MEYIRPYQNKDHAQMEQICIATAGEGFHETAARVTGCLTAFCRYYITHSPDTCFVAASEEDTAVGYVLCAPSFGHWARTFWKEAIAVFPFGILWGIGSILEAQPYAREYPAHLHINLLEPFRHKGLGRQLIHALEEKLRSKNCPGVMLCVSSSNQNAIRFYESCGFRALGQYPGSIVYGKKL